MPKEKPKAIGKFALGILLLKHEDGKVEFRFQTRNQNIPIEIILTQVKAWLRQQENRYNDNFDKNTFEGQEPSDEP